MEDDHIKQTESIAGQERNIVINVGFRNWSLTERGGGEHVRATKWKNPGSETFGAPPPLKTGYSLLCLLFKGWKLFAPPYHYG